jgi:RNA polymerase sigma-70 factor (ECF subfamily)
MEKEVFTLRFMDQLSIREISQTLKKNESTVKTHLYRGLQKFRKETSLHDFLQEVIS